MTHDEEYLLTWLERYSMYTSFVELRGALLAESKFRNVRSEIKDYVDRNKENFAQKMSQVTALVEHQKRVGSTTSPLPYPYDASSSSKNVVKKFIKNIKDWMVEKKETSMGDLLNSQDSDQIVEYVEVLKYCYREPSNS